MITDNDGNYYIYDNDDNNIDYYISALFNMQDFLKKILRKEPQTREAFINASYKDVITMRVLALDVAHLLNEINDSKTFHPTPDEIAEVLSQHPFSYGND